MPSRFPQDDGWIIHPYKSFPATLHIVSLEGGASGGGRLEIVEESFVRCRNNSTSIFLQLAIRIEERSPYISYYQTRSIFSGIAEASDIEMMKLKRFGRE
jgi:hypothetical protein